MIGYGTRVWQPRYLSARDAYHRRRRRRAEAQRPAEDRFRLDQIMSREALFQTALTLQKSAGDSPGPSGTRLSELTRSELGAMAGALAERISADTYWPGPRRIVAIEKPTGGTRPLRIQNIEDKVVARRLKDALEPVIDSLFVDASYGFRPRKNAWQLLARLKVNADRLAWYVLVVCDVRRAFDSVSIDKIMCAFVDLLRQSGLGQCSLQTQDELLKLIAMVLLGGQAKREVGIDTGCPFSPLALNALLHMNHDLLFLERSNKPLWVREAIGKRYADNIVCVTPDGSKGRQVLGRLGRHFLGQNLPLKEDAQIYDLQRGTKAPLLGFLATLRDGRLTYELPDAAVCRLDEHLDDAHAKPDSTKAVHAAVVGWLAWIGPALENGRRLLPQVLRSLNSGGFRDVISRNALLRHWRESCRRWRELLAAEEKRQGEKEGV